ncbi:hypothetical protein TWF102_006937 [Orbilia oligospora]|uniref:F-box domain-containing protein n=1 Tax=Orbilia oligospora TaxID=2813651 RepID=A0A7C8JFT8_ORBOL|nr:hypothetical protein TWF102_006937 [Orbilia oligospora]KAF3114253.1 hypothetical protein TWF706_008190 [Orbilia oligospora]
MEPLENDVTSTFNALTLEETTGPENEPGRDQGGDEAKAAPVTFKPVFPTELEVEIISRIPLKYWGTVRRVCKRWHAITLLPDFLYLPITTLPLRVPELHPDFKPFTFKIHRAIYEVADYLGEQIALSGFRKPDPRVCQRLIPYLDHQLTKPPLPHTLQDVQFNILMPPREERTVRPKHAFKVMPVPCGTFRKLIVVPHPTNPKVVEFKSLNRDQKPTGITVGEFFDTVAERSRVRPGDTYEKMILNWRVRNPEKDWWWKEWGIPRGFYKMDIVVWNEGVEQQDVSVTFCAGTLILHHKGALTSPGCPNELEEPSPSLSSGQRTLYADKFDSFITSLSGISWVQAFSNTLLPAILNAYKILESLEGDEEYGSISIIPLPEKSLRGLYEFIVRRKIHCYAAKSSEKLILSLVRIDEATGTGGMSDFVESDPSSPSDDLQTQANSGAGSLKSPGDESFDPRTFFQYTNVDVLQVLKGTVDSYSFQLRQLEAASKVTYSSHEKELLQVQTDFWGQLAATSLLRLWHLFEAGEPYFRESDPWDSDDLENWLKIIEIQTGVDYGDQLEGNFEYEGGYDSDMSTS